MKRALLYLIAWVVTAAATAQTPISKITSLKEESGDGSSMSWVDVAEYTPLALPWAIKALGGATRSGWGRMATSQGASLAIMCAGVYATKLAVDRRRPDGTDTHSFPSGHTAWSFLGATMATRELAWRSPWYSIGAYTLASAIGQQRIISRRHYATDVAAGAAIGIAAAQLGYYIGDRIFGARQIDDRYNFTGGTAGNRTYLSITSGIDFRMGDAAIGNSKIHFSPGFTSALDFGAALDDHLLVALRGGVTTTPIEMRESDGTVTEAGSRPLTTIDLAVMPGFCVPASERLSLTARAGAGYRFNAGLDWPGMELESGKGTAIGIVDLSANISFTENFSCSASVYYNVGKYEFTTSGGIESKGTAHSIGIGLSSRIDF